MKSNKLLICLGLAITLVAGMGLALGGCKTASTNFKKPAPSYSPEEEVIRRLILKATENFNKERTKAFLECYSEDAQIMVWIKGKLRMVSKVTYAKMFPKEFAKVGKARYESLSVEVNDNIAKAEGVVSISKGFGEDIVWTKKYLDLIYQDGRWLIVKSSIDVYFRGDVDPRDKTRSISTGDKLD